MSRSLMVVAGEASGDMHAAQVVRELKMRDPELRVWGLGGDACEAEGMEVLHHVRDMSVMGLAEVIRRYGFFKQVFSEVVEAVKERRPDVVLLVDYPGFNLRLAEKVCEMGIKVIFYICPQVWAWKPGRIKKMARILDRLLVIFPFEKALFEGTGLAVDFVGHPLVDACQAAWDAPMMELPWKGSKKIALLPGSRAQEVERIFPVMWEAAVALDYQDEEVSFIIPAVSEQMEKMIRGMMVVRGRSPSKYAVVRGHTREVLRQADAAWVTSGTATLESGLMGCPTVVVYKTSPMTYWVGRMLVRLDHIGMVNIVAGREVCPELIQHDAKAGALVSAITPLLTDTSERVEMIEGLNEVKRALGEGAAGEKVADIVMSELGAETAD